MIGGFSEKAFASGAFFTPCVIGLIRRLSLPQKWLALEAGVFVCERSAVVLVLRGAPWAFSGGVLSVSGAVLIGSAGGVYGFASVLTAGRWLADRVERLRADLSILQGMSAADAAVWLAAANGTLFDYAYRLVDNAARQGDDDKRAALLAESALCVGFWGGR